MKRVMLLICLSICVLSCSALLSAEDQMVGIEVSSYPVPEACIVELCEPELFAGNEAEWIRHEGSLWTRLGDGIYLPEFYEPGNAVPGYLKARMYRPGKWEATIEFAIGCNHFAEPADVAGLIGDAISIVAEGHRGFGAFEDDLGYDDAWLERSLDGAIVAIHPVGQEGKFRVEFVIIGYKIRWYDHLEVWHEQSWF
ncbi:hypothetical protein ACFL0Z_02045 [Patescibacteria group bacterium]